MKQGWEYKTLGDVLDVLRNGVNCKQDKKGVGDKISRIESISNADFDFDKIGFARLSKSDKEKYRLAKGDILFSHINSPIHVGKTALFNSDEEVYHGVNLLLMRPKPFLDGNYFEHFLKYIFQNGYWKGLCKQSVNQASVNQQDINKVEISFPKSLPEQQRIVAILDEAFAAIAKAKANAEQNLRNAKEVFESYLQGVFEEKGEGWEEKTLGEVCLFKGGGTPSTKVKEYWEGEIPWVSPKDMKSKIISNSQDHLTIEAIKNSSASLIPKGSILIVVRSGILARIVPIGITEEVVSINQDLKALCPKKNIDSNFLCYFMEGNMRFLLSKVTRGATVHRISTDSLRDLRIGVPNIKDQQTIVKKLDTLSTETKKLEAIYQQKINDLEEMKKSILQKAFSGGLNYDSFD
jgi:type I restriction enzyme S subunit